MTLPPPDDADDVRGRAALADRGAAIVVGVAAFLVYVLAAAPAPYLLDAAELAEAAFGLGVAHPPGEPLAALWGKLFTLLPFGSVSFRVALGQGAAAALAAVLLLRIGRLLLPAPPSATRAWAARIVLAAAALLFAVAPGVVMSAARPEVYALQAALSLATLQLSLAAGRSGDARPALGAAALIGLGLGVHPLIGGLTALGAVWAALPLLRRAPRRAPLRLVLLSVGMVLAGAAVLLYLPARAAAHPALSWGDAHSLARLGWLLSARTFAAKSGVIHTNTSAADAPFMLMEELSLAGLLLALAGAYGLLRARATRFPAVALLIAAGGSIGAALIAGLDPSNPDIRGYLMPAIALLALLAAAGVLLPADLLLGSRPRLALGIAVSLFALVVARAPGGLTRGGLGGATGAAVAGVRLLATLPPRAALLTSDFQTAFLTGYLRTVEGWRPDVAWAHLGFVGGPGYIDRVAQEQPELHGALRAFEQWNGRFGAALDALQQQRPVRLESDTRLGTDIMRTLRPAGLTWKREGATPGKAAGGALGDPVVDQLADQIPGDSELHAYLSWRRYSDAQVACQSGPDALARTAVDRMLQLSPDDTRARALADACRAR